MYDRNFDKGSKKEEEEEKFSDSKPRHFPRKWPRQKEMCKIFRNYDLKITIDVNHKIVNFLDVTFDLESGLFKPFMKPNDIPVYVHKKSNHPPAITQNLPQSVNRRLSSISANEGVFKDAKPQCQNLKLM